MPESCLKTTVRYNSAKSNYALFFKSKQLTQQKPLVRQCHCQRREARRQVCIHLHTHAFESTHSFHSVVRLLARSLFHSLAHSFWINNLDIGGGITGLYIHIYTLRRPTAISSWIPMLWVIFVVYRHSFHNQKPSSFINGWFTLRLCLNVLIVCAFKIPTAAARTLSQLEGTVACVFVKAGVSV